eukprot:2167540-Pleurochrysis_carterae.AAC.1
MAQIDEEGGRLDVKWAAGGASVEWTVLKREGRVQGAVDAGGRRAPNSKYGTWIREEAEKG